MLKEAVTYLEERKSKLSGSDGKDSGSYEVIVVDDGSTDGTALCALDFAQSTKVGGDSIRIIKLERNRGKGAAVTHVSRAPLLSFSITNPNVLSEQGMMFARGRLLLFADADGATKFSDLAKLEAAMDRLLKLPPKSANKNLGVVLGSRAHMVNSPAVIQRSALRNALMRSFHVYLNIMGISTVKDTQCGFKLFTRSAGRVIFPNMHVEGWIFDIEIILLAALCQMPIAEVPVTWSEVDGSKVSLIKDSLKMALDLLIIRSK